MDQADIHATYYGLFSYRDQGDAMMSALNVECRRHWEVLRGLILIVHVRTTRIPSGHPLVPRFLAETPVLLGQFVTALSRLMTPPSDSPRAQLPLPDRVIDFWHVADPVCKRLLVWNGWVDVVFQAVLQDEDKAGRICGWWQNHTVSLHAVCEVLTNPAFTLPQPFGRWYDVERCRTSEAEWDTEAARADILWAMASGKHAIMFQALPRLRHVPDAQARTILHELARTAHRALRLEAISDLRRFGDAETIALLVALLQDPDDLIAKYAASTLGDLGAVEAMMSIYAMRERLGAWGNRALGKLVQRWSATMEGS